jgi:RNA polymerase sigma factor (sigma-70 family)
VSQGTEKITRAIYTCFEDPDNVEKLEAFDGLFRPFMLAVLVSMTPDDPGFAEDAYQTAFVKFIQIFRGGRKPSIRYDAYFVAVAKHCLIDELRSRSRTSSIEELLDCVSDDREAKRIESLDRNIALFQGLSRLARRCHYLLESYYIRGATIDELSISLGIQKGSVQTAISRCREALRRIIKN